MRPSCQILRGIAALFYKFFISRGPPGIEPGTGRGVPCLLSNKRPKCPSFRAVIGFRVTCPMESSVLFRFATSFIRRSNPVAPSSPYLPNTQSKRGLRRVRDSNPRGVAACLVSGEVHSATLPTLQTAAGLTDGGGSEQVWELPGCCQAPGALFHFTIGLVTLSQYRCS